MECYPFEFLGTDNNGTDEYLRDTLVYRFESQKSCHRYYEVESHSLYVLVNSMYVPDGYALTNRILAFLGVTNS